MLEIRIVEAQDKRSAAAAGEEPVEQGGAGVADMDAAGRRWREPDDRKRGHSPSYKRRAGAAIWCDKAL
jgi:hypothetical protein